MVKQEWLARGVQIPQALFVFLMNHGREKFITAMIR